MRRLYPWIVLLASSFCATAQPRPALPRASDEVIAVKAQEEALRQAELKYDAAAAATLLADDFVLTAASDGSLWTKAKFLPLIGDRSDPMELLEYGDMDVHIYGNAAVVLSSIHEKFWYQKKLIEYRGRRTAVWIKQNQRWLCVTIHASK